MEMYLIYALLRKDVLVEAEIVSCACMERGIEFYVKISRVDWVFEEYNNVFLIVRDHEED